MGNGTALRTATGWARVILALFVCVAALAAPPARADLRAAYNDYKKADYPRAFQEFMALAELGQPQAQFVVARMYHDGQGTDWSDIHAYAWASLAAANGEEHGTALAAKIRPTLAPGSERVAGWLTLPYTEAALERTLLPDLSGASAQGPAALSPQPSVGCKRKVVRMYFADYPRAARQYGVEGEVLAGYTLMPDGSLRLPHIIYAIPVGVFEDVVKEDLLRSRFATAPQGTPPVRCSLRVDFTLGPPPRDRDKHTGPGIPATWVAQAHAGDPGAQLLYGLLLGGRGVPWLVKAAQAGIPAAQYGLAHELLAGEGCRKDTAKALTWLRMAANQNQPDAEFALAARLLRGRPNDSDVTRAKTWLERAAAHGGGNGGQSVLDVASVSAVVRAADRLKQPDDHNTGDGSQEARLLLAALLAATPQPALRDPTRALELMSGLRENHADPTPLEIRAAAQAAEGHCTDAMRSEQSAISRARRLGWDLSPLKQRLASYQSGKPWYGSLIPL